MVVDLKIHSNIILRECVTTLHLRAPNCAITIKIQVFKAKRSYRRRFVFTICCETCSTVFCNWITCN